ncbi:DUF6615 family protein [Nocardia sp. NPDC057030]|uniref:DUF6615 family protein n=1 Tax=unclassified Nocardia TaxID=2637762 RepID=UPI0036250F1B
MKNWASWVSHQVDEPKVAVTLGKWARWTGRRIARGEAHGIRQPEETLTNSLLLDLCRELPDLRVKMTGRADEAVEGSDWEWWIEGESKWFGALVQAKRTTGDGRINFGYKPAPSKRNPHPEHQLDSLIATAEDLRIPPLYVLYNDTEAGLPLSTADCAQYPLLPSGSAGVTVLSGYAARWLWELNRNRPVSVQEVSRYAMPWSCLVSCPRTCRAGLWPWRNPHALRMGLGLDPTTPSGVDRAVDAAMAVGRLESMPYKQQFATTIAPTLANNGIHDNPPWYLPARPGNRDIKSGLEDAVDDETAARYVVALYRRPR